MSILAAAEPVTTADLALFGALVAVGLGVACAIGVFRRQTVNGPVRIPQHEPLRPVLYVFLAALATWFGAQVVYGVYRAFAQRAGDTTAPTTGITLGPEDFAILGTVPFVAGVIVLMLGDVIASPSLPRKLGWSLNRLPGGFLRGLLGIVILLPILLGAGVWLEALYRAVGYEHPAAHEMLQVLVESRDPLLRGALIFGATILAPLFEEFFFRGHLQTALVRAFARRPRPSFAPAPAMPFPPTAAPLDPAPIEPVAQLAPAEPSAAARWAAIAVASLVFAVLHPAWTWPLIFLLSLGIGYAYERTGNLWVAVFMHLFFNTFNTVVTLVWQPFEHARPPL